MLTTAEEAEEGKEEGGIRGRGERRGEKTITEFYCMMLFIIPIQSAHTATGPAAVLYLLNDPINMDDYHDHRNHNNSLDSTARRDTELGKVTVIQQGQNKTGRDQAETRLKENTQMIEAADQCSRLCFNICKRETSGYF